MPLIYAPDADPTTPGVITLAHGVRPTAAGFGTWPGYGLTDWATLGTQVFGGYAHHYQSAGRIIVGGGTKLYELSLTASGTHTVTDVSKGGGSYTAGSWTGTPDGQSDPQYWAFTSFGAYCLASNKFNDTIQVQTAKAGAFADIAGSPECSALCTFKNFVLAGNCGNYGSITGTNDMVAWSALGDHTSWVPAASTQAGYLQLLDVPGRIVAMKPLGDAVAVYKENAIWLLRYVGNPSVFSAQLVVNNKGILATYDKPAPIVDLGKAHLIVTEDDVMIFDGNTLQSVAEGVIREQLRPHVVAGLSDGYRTTLGRYASTTITHDLRTNNIIFWNWHIGTYTETAKPAPTEMYGAPVYNYRLNRWGIHEPEITLTMNSVSGGARLPCAAIEASATRIGGGTPGIIYDPGTIILSNKKSYYCYTPTTGLPTTFAAMSIAPIVGNAGVATTLQRVVPKFRVGAGSTTTALAYYRLAYLGATPVYDSDGVWDSTNHRFDIVKNAYWHQPALTFQDSGGAYANTEIRDIEYSFQAPAGKRIESPLVKGL